MTVSFPTSVHSFATLVDLADSVLAAHQNDRSGEIEAIEGWLLDHVQTKYKLLVTISSDDLVVKLVHIDETDPSSSNPLYIMIDGTVRSVTSALSITIASGTNWFDAGSTAMATKEIDYAVYAVWDSNSSAVALSIARIYGGRLVSDFSSSSTNQKHLYGYSGFTSTDPVAVIGRIAATLSAGAGYTWTSSSYSAPDNANTVNHPIDRSRRLDFTWSPSNLTKGNGTSSEKYQVIGNNFFVDVQFVFGSTSSISGSLTFSLPFSIDIGASAAAAPIGLCNMLDNGTGTFYGTIDENNATTVRIRCINVSATYATLTAISGTVPFTWTTSDEINFQLSSLPIL